MCTVTFKLGFSDQSSFTRAFRRWTGETPGEYKARPQAA
ncbi:helix-turn-helix domain-containing protein [Hydrocarboniphaga sp.]